MTEVPSAAAVPERSVNAACRRDDRSTAGRPQRSQLNILVCRFRSLSVATPLAQFARGKTFSAA